MLVHLFIQVWPLGEWAAGASAMADPRSPTCLPLVRCVLMWTSRDLVVHVMTDRPVCLCREPLRGSAGAVRGHGPAFGSPPSAVLFFVVMQCPLRSQNGQGDLVVCARSRDGESVARETASHGLCFMCSR
jgi:hypothetical protein